MCTENELKMTMENLTNWNLVPQTVWHINCHLSWHNWIYLSATEDYAMLYVTTQDTILTFMWNLLWIQENLSQTASQGSNDIWRQVAG